MSEGPARRKWPALATIYAHWLRILPYVARRHGYALAVHGSMCTDLDLIAVPWVDDCATPHVLAEALANTCDANLLADDPAERQHGRLVWTIHFGQGPYIDLSVIPPKGGEH